MYSVISNSAQQAFVVGLIVGVPVGLVSGLIAALLLKSQQGRIFGFSICWAAVFFVAGCFGIAMLGTSGPGAGIKTIDGFYWYLATAAAIVAFFGVSQGWLPGAGTSAE